MESEHPVVEFNTVEPLYSANILRAFYSSAAPQATENRKMALPEAHVNEFRKKSLKNTRAAINRNLKDINRDIDIVRDKPFIMPMICSTQN